MRARNDENSLVKPCVERNKRLDIARFNGVVHSRRAFGLLRARTLNYLNLVAACSLQDQIVRYLGGGRRHAQRQRKAAGLGAALAHEKRARRLSGQHLQGDFARQTRLEPGGALQLLVLERVEARRRRSEDLRTGVGCEWGRSEENGVSDSVRLYDCVE